MNTKQQKCYDTEMARWSDGHQDVPDYIPYEQVAKYRAIKRQERCAEGKIRKRAKLEKQRRNKPSRST